MRELLSQTSMASSASEEPPDAVERDPSRRYWRCDEVLGRGAFKTVYKAFDEREGIEVAWNKVSLGGAVQEGDNRDRLFAEINVLKRLKHKNIMTFYDSWLDEKSNTLNFITELFTDGSLRKFRFKHKHLELKVLKKWAWQILQGLVYLHGHEPPIIHRDLKCDNIFINGVSGVLKIGDLGLATLWKGLTAPQSVLGTPEFMAPEYYNEKYDEKVDVYAFGMLLLELASMDYPYCECTNPAAIFKKVSQGIYPASLQKIRTKELRNFIELCIAHEPKDRLATRKLLKHPFFNSVRSQMDPKRQRSTDDMTASVASSHSSDGDLQSDPSCRVTRLSSEKIAKLQERRQSADVSSSQEYSISGGVEGGSQGLDGNGEEWKQGDDCDPDDKCSEHSGGEGHAAPPPSPFARQADNEGQSLSIQCTKLDGTNLMFTLRFEDLEGKKKVIQFPFNLEDDTADQIVSEMVEEHSHINLSITEEEADLIGQMIGKEVERSRNEGSEELTAYVSVQRTVGEPNDSTVEPPPPVNGVMESIMGGFMENLATNHHSGEEDFARALSATTGDILAVMNKGEGVLGSCMMGRGPPLMPVIHENTWSSSGEPGVANRGCSGTETTGRDQLSGKGSEGHGTCVHSEAIDIKSPARNANLVVSPLHTASSSPPCPSHVRCQLEKGNQHRKQRAKSEPPESDESSPRIVGRKSLSGRPSSEGSIGLKAAFRKEFSRFEQLEGGDPSTSVPDKLLESFGGEKMSPRTDAPFPTSVSLLLLQKKGTLGECQEGVQNPRRMAEVTFPEATEQWSRSPDGKLTAISMVTVKPPTVPGSHSPSFGFQTLESRSTPTFVNGMDLGETKTAPEMALEEKALSHLSESLHSASPNVSPRGSDTGCGSPWLTSAGGESGHGEPPSYPLVLGISNSLPAESAFGHGPPAAVSVQSSDLDSVSQVGRRESTSSLTQFEATMLRSVPVAVSDYHSENGVVPAVRPMLDARLFSEEVELDDIGHIGSQNTPVSIGMLDRAATPPLIPVGHPHLTCAASNTPPSVGSMARSWASVASGGATLAKHHSFESEKQHQQHQQHKGFPDSMATQTRSRSPEEKSMSMLTEELSGNAIGSGDLLGGPHGVRRRSVSTHEPIDLRDMVSKSRVLPFGSKSMSIGRSSVSNQTQMLGIDFERPSAPINSASPPPLINGDGNLTFEDRSGSPSGVSLPDLGGNSTWPSDGQTASFGRNSSDGETRPPVNVVVSSQSSSPSGVASPLALSASGDNGDQRTVQKSVDKELRHKRAELKVKEMEVQQLDKFCSGFSTRGRSITKSKPLRPPLNGSGPV